MINEIFLDGFQKHTERLIRLQPGLNVIVGDTDTGKSAIIRGLRWLALHEPTTADLIQHGKSGVFVGIHTPNGHTRRYKNAKKNGYAHESEEFFACGTEQPIAITMAHGLIPENFQAQHDLHFLLSLAPGQLAKEINRIVALDDIDAATRWLRTRSIGIATSLADTEIELEAAAAHREAIKSRIDEQEHRFEHLTAARDRFIQKSEEQAKVHEIVLQSDQLIPAIEKHSNQITVLEKVIEARAAYDALEASKKGVQSILSSWRLVESTDALSACIEAGEALKRKLEELGRLEAIQGEQITAERQIEEVICTIRDTVTKGSAIIQALRNKAEALAGLGLERKRRDLEINTCKKQILLCELNISGLPKTICPACGQEIK